MRKLIIVMVVVFLALAIVGLLKGNKTGVLINLLISSAWVLVYGLVGKEERWEGE